EAQRVYALLGMAAVLDGDAARASAAVASLKGARADSWAPAKADPACAALGSPAPVVASAAQIVARARASDSSAGKSRAAQNLLANVHWYFALWAAAGLLLLQFGREAVHARC